MSKKLKFMLIGLVTLSLITSCGNKQNKEKTSTPKEEPKKETIPAIDVQNMKTDVNPGYDFFTYTNGGWLEKNPIPEDKAIYGAFNELDDSNKEKLKTLINEIAAKENVAQGSIEQKIKDFYNTGMDTAKIEADGIKPLQKELDKINAVTDFKSALKQIAYMHRIGVNPFFHIHSTQDKKNSEMMIMGIYQGGLNLPDRDYYLADNERSEEIRKAYKKHIANMFKILGEDEDTAKKKADIVMNFETKLAEFSMPRLECRDPKKTYNKKSFKELSTENKDIDWTLLLNEIGVKIPDSLNISQTDFVSKTSRYIASTKIDDLKTLLSWKMFSAFAYTLNKEVVEENFNFYGKVLSGQKTMQARWRRVLNATSGAVGEAIGQVYVKKYFPPEAKEKMLALVGNLKKSYKNRLSKLSWMSEETKTQALAKLEAMRVKIGYPDKWKDYSELEVNTNSYMENMKNAKIFHTKRNLEKIGKAVDKDEWHMTPQTVNAYYNPGVNEIVFPAGILQPPFFNMYADDAVNYGSIGVVIGHEITHGFDDQGRKYDKDGNMKNWWTEEDAKKFETQTKLIVDQFSAFNVINDMHIDGKLTLGENIADFGGLVISLDAFKLANPEYEKMEKIDNFTALQRFFIGYAQVWRNNIRDKELMRRLKEDVHSPGKYRVNGTLFNIPEFYTAFGIKETDTLYRTEAQRPNIW